MLTWSIMARACRSASKRAMTWRLSMPGLMTLRATLRWTGWVCSAMKTTPMPPSPICCSSLYGPMTVPGPPRTPARSPVARAIGEGARGKGGGPRGRGKADRGPDGGYGGPGNAHKAGPGCQRPGEKRAYPIWGPPGTTRAKAPRRRGKTVERAPTFSRIIPGCCPASGAADRGLEPGPVRTPGGDRLRMQRCPRPLRPARRSVLAK